MYAALEKKLHEIADVLFGDMARGKVGEGGMVGLYAGQTGILVFCKQYLAHYPDARKAEILEQFTENTCFESLTSGITLLTYCSGLAGALEGLRYLNRRMLSDIDYSDIEEHYKPFLQQFALSGIMTENYDYLHGGLGVVEYFRDDTQFVLQALEALEQAAQKEGGIYKWISGLGIDRGKGYNVCLSHGMSSILSVLSALPESERRDRIIDHTAAYILSQEIDPEKYGNCFPSQSMENPQESGRSRLGWCYGDLGIATALWQAGKARRNAAWREKALAVMEFSAHRRSPEKSSVNDAGICHGAAGIAMMFHYMYLQTSNALFCETRDHWIDVTLKLGIREEGLAGYSAWRPTETPPWKNEYNLLEGIAGIGLMLLTMCSDDLSEGDWMGFFMLNR